MSHAGRLVVRLYVCSSKFELTAFPKFKLSASPGLEPPPSRLERDPG